MIKIKHFIFFLLLKFIVITFEDLLLLSCFTDKIKHDYCNYGNELTNYMQGNKHL